MSRTSDPETKEGVHRRSTQIHAHVSLGRALSLVRNEKVISKRNKELSRTLKIARNKKRIKRKMSMKPN